MNPIAKLCLLLSFAVLANAEIVKPPPNVFDEVPVNGGPRVRIIQLPSKIVTVNVPGKTETRYVQLPEKKKIVPAAEFAAMKKEWDDELESAQCEIALKYAARIDTAPVDGDDILNAKRDEVEKAFKACAAAPSVITRKALVAAVERYIAR